MATRNLSLEYAELRSIHRSNYPRGSEDIQRAIAAGSANSTANNNTTPGGGSGGTTDPGSHTVDIDTTPAWVRLVSEIKSDVVQLNEDLHLLHNLHTARLRIAFDEDSIRAQDASIQSLADTITARLNRCLANNKRIVATALAARPPPTQQDRTVIFNAMRACALETGEQTKTFRRQQKAFLDQLSAQQKQEEQIAASNTSHHHSAAHTTHKRTNTSALSDGMLDAIMDPNQSLDQQQQVELEQMNEDATAREKEIIRVAQSINELAQLFKELNVLVIDQGTILDRIDYNVEQAKERVEKGVEDLKAADDISQKAVTAKCIGILVIIVVVLLIALVIKWSS